MPNRVAIFWDFDSLHSDLMVENYGANQYKRIAQREQPEAIDVGAVMEYAQELGRVAVNRAFCNWLRMGRYAEVLDEYSVELIQLFPLPHAGTHSVSRRVSAELLNYSGEEGAKTTVLLVGGGSEYVQIGRTLRERGFELIGLGPAASADDLWVATCHKFVHYRDLKPREMELETSAGVDFAEAQRLLVRAVNELSRHYGTAWIQQVKIKPAIVRLNAAFDERDLGYESFSSFLRDQTEFIERRHRPGEQEPEFRLLPQHAEENFAESAGDNDQQQLVRYYIRVASQQGIRMPDPTIMWEGIDVYASFLHDGVTFATFSDIDEECLRLLREDFPDVNMTDVKKVRQILFKCFLFRPSVEDTIGFHEEVKGLADIEDRYFELMLARIAGNLSGPVDYEALSLALTGNPEQADRLRELDQSRSPA